MRDVYRAITNNSPTIIVNVDCFPIESRFYDFLYDQFFGTGSVSSVSFSPIISQNPLKVRWLQNSSDTITVRRDFFCKTKTKKILFFKSCDVKFLTRNVHFKQLLNK